MFFGKQDNKEIPLQESDNEASPPPKVFELASSSKDEERGNPFASPTSTDRVEATVFVAPSNKGEDNDEVEVEVEVAPAEKKNCSALAMDILSIGFLFLMSIFFICGSAFIHPRGSEGRAALDEPYTFFLVGALAYIAHASVDIFKRKSKGTIEMIAASIGFLGGFFWFVGSIFLFRATADLKSWGGCWIFGSICIMSVITYDIIILIKSPTKPLFEAIALMMSWLANLFFVGGAGHFIALLDYNYLTYCDIGNAANVLIAGSAMYLIHCTFVVLAIFMDNIIFSIHVSRSAPAPSASESD